MKNYSIGSGEEKYSITLDDNNQILHVTEGNNLSEFRRDPDFNSNLLLLAFQHLSIGAPKKFEELYEILRENDPNMFEIASLAINNISDPD